MTKDRDEAVHEARKRFKKLRAVVRLVRDEIGDDVYQQENTCYRDAGRLLSDVRDAAVMVQTLDDIADYFADHLRPDAFREIRARLSAAHHQTRQWVLDEENTVAKVIAMVEEAQNRIPKWPIENHNEDFGLLAPSLKRVYKRGLNRLEDACADPTPEHFHEWRKRVKYLWYHIRILKPVWLEVMDALADDIHLLSDYLGDHHDLSELRQAVLDSTDYFNNKSDLHTLLALIDKRRNELVMLSYPLGQRVYVETPSQFVSRIAGYWKAWQHG